MEVRRRKRTFIRLQLPQLSFWIYWAFKTILTHKQAGKLRYFFSKSKTLNWWAKISNFMLCECKKKKKMKKTLGEIIVSRLVKVYGVTDGST